MMKLGRIISSEITENRDGEKKVLLLQAEITGPEDIKTVEYIQAAFVDARPPAGVSIFIDDLGAAWMVAPAADDGIEPESPEGQIEFYAINPATLARVASTRTKLKTSGTVEIGVSSLDFVALAQKVLDELEDIKTDLDGFKSTFDLHVHTSGCSAGGTPTLAPTSSFPVPHTPGSVASSNLKSEG